MPDQAPRLRRLPVVVGLALLLVGGSIGFPTATHAVSSIGKLKDEGQFELTKPWGVATDEFGDIYVVDSRADRVVKFDRDTQQPEWATAGGTGSEPGQLFNPEGIAVGDGLIFVADTSNHRISMFTYEGRPAGDLTDGDVPFAYPADVDFHNGYLYVTNGGARCTVDILKKSGSRFSRDGVFGGCGSEPGQFSCPAGVAVTDQHAYVTDQCKGLVKRFFVGGGYVSTFGSYGTGPGQFEGPTSIAVSTTDAGGTSVWVLDAGTPSRVQKFTGEGELITSFGGFTFPHGLALSPTADRLYVADTSAEDPDVHAFVDSAPELYLAPDKNLKHLVKTEGVWFLLAYNQETKSCAVLAKATVSVPGHPAFTVDKDFKVGSVAKDYKIDVSDKQAKWMKQADAANKKVSISAVFRGNCSEGAKVSAKEAYKAS